jgi:hypothetical protein
MECVIVSRSQCVSLDPVVQTGAALAMGLLLPLGDASDNFVGTCMVWESRGEKSSCLAHSSDLFHIKETMPRMVEDPD